MHRNAYKFLDARNSATFVEAISAHDYVRPSLLRLGEGDAGIGDASLPEGALGGITDDYMRFRPLGIEN